MKFRRHILNIALKIEHDFDIITEDTFTGKFFYCTCSYDEKIVNGTWSLTQGSQYASINSNGKVMINEGVTSQQIEITCTYRQETDTKQITVSYDNQLTIECQDLIAGTSGNAIARFNSTVVEPTWSITSGSQYGTIDSSGNINVLGTGEITVNAAYSSYTATKVVGLYYDSSTTSHTEVNEDGSVTTETTTTNVDPETGETTETTTSETVNEDGSTSNTSSQTVTQEDGSSATQSTTTNSDGTSSETQQTVSAPDEQGTTVSNSTTVNYDENGDTTGSSANTTTNNTDGSSSSTTTNYNAEGDPTDKQNQDIDSSGNQNTQDIVYNEDGDEVVTAYNIDTTNNPSGNGENISAGIDTQFIPFDGTNGFELLFHFKALYSQQPNPPIVPDEEDKSIHYQMVNAKRTNQPWYGFGIRFSNKTQITYQVMFNGDAKTTNVSKNMNSDGIYKVKITYDPNASTKYIVRDLLTGTNIYSANKSFGELSDLQVTIGYALNMQGEPYRYSNIYVYEFDLKKI